MSFKVPRPAPPVDAKAMDAFVNGSLTPTPKAWEAQGTTPPAAAVPDEKIPHSQWALLDNKTRKPAFNLSLTALEKAQLEFVTNELDESMHKFVLKAAKKAVKDALQRLEREKE